MIKDPTKFKVFGRRKGKRLSNLQKKNLSQYLDEFSIFKSENNGELPLRKINPINLFNNVKEVELEIGFGMGDFIFKKAMEKPDVGFIGCEIYENGIASLLSRIIKFDIKNILIHPGNCIELIENLNINTLKSIYILFPDPWPKNKHKKRRFFNANNSDKLCCLLKNNGSLNVATDISDYANQISNIMKKNDGFFYEELNFQENKSSLNNESKTKYAKKAIMFGRETNYMIFRKKNND